jgi:hypothetical protein
MNPADGGICIFPERGEDLEFGPGTGGGSVLHPPDGMEVGFAVEYRGFHDTGYVTRLSVRSSHGGFEVTSVDVR